jgi:pimeloyl-ACP methyl ester carboxylesterase
MQSTYLYYLNRRVAVYKMEAGSKKTIVLIHGNSVHAGFFEPLMQLLALGGFDVVTFDLPGHGNSEKWAPEDYTKSNLLDLFLRVVEKYGVGETGLFGFSLGGVFLIELLPSLKNIQKVAIAGSPPLDAASDVGKAYILNEKVLKVFQGEYTGQDALDYYEGILSYGDMNFKEEILQSLLAADPEFRMACGRMVGEIQNQVAMINRFPGEFCLLHAAHDKVVNLEYLRNLKINNLWNTEVRKPPVNPILHKPGERFSFGPKRSYEKAIKTGTAREDVFAHKKV